MSSKNKIILGVVVIVVIVLAAVFFFAPSRINAPVKEQPSTATTTADGWNIYTSKAYNVTFDYPSDWQVFVGKAAGDTTVINVYKKSETAKPPFTHQSDVTQVSLFPRGVPTEGLRGKPVPSAVVFQEPVTTSIDYNLDSGKPFATLANFTNVPSAWESYGFAFARVKIDNPQIYCLKNGAKVSETQCDLGVESADADIMYSGNVNEADRATEVKILESIKFTAEQ